MPSLEINSLERFPDRANYYIETARLDFVRHLPFSSGPQVALEISTSGEVLSSGPAMRGTIMIAIRLRVANK